MDVKIATHLFPFLERRVVKLRSAGSLTVLTSVQKGFAFGIIATAVLRFRISCPMLRLSASALVSPFRIIIFSFVARVATAEARVSGSNGHGNGAFLRPKQRRILQRGRFNLGGDFGHDVCRWFSAFRVSRKGDIGDFSIAFSTSRPASASQGAAGPAAVILA